MLWSGTAVANKIAVQQLDGLTVGLLRSAVAGAIVLPIALGLRLPFPRQSKNRLLLGLSGLASFALWPILLSLGLERSTVGHAALIMASIPIFTVLGSSWTLGRLPSGRWWLGAIFALGATGVLILLRGSFDGSRSFDDGFVGDTLVLLGCFACSVGYVAGARVTAEVGALSTTFWGLAAALIFVVPTCLATIRPADMSGLSIATWQALLWLVCCSSVLGYALWFFALSRGGVGPIASLQLFLPVLTMIAAVVLLEERLSVPVLIVAVSILVGTAVAQRHAPQAE